MTKQAADCAIPNVRSEVMGLLEKMRGAINNGSHERMYQLTDQMELLTRTYLEPALINPLPGVRITQSEARMIARLAAAKGSVVTKAQLMDALYYDRPHDEPDAKIVDVFVCKLRNKLKRMANAPFNIQTVWGNGYTLNVLA